MRTASIDRLGIEPRRFHAPERGHYQTFDPSRYSNAIAIDSTAVASAAIAGSVVTALASLALRTAELR